MKIILIGSDKSPREKIPLNPELMKSMMAHALAALAIICVTVGVIVLIIAINR